MSASTDYSWTLPVSGLDTKYPYNNVTQTESGHFQEWDDTPGAERIRTQHRNGTYTEMLADGSNVVKVLGKNYTIVAKDNNVLIKGICNITVQGDSVLEVYGNVFENIHGDYNKVVEGDYNVLAKGEVTFNAGGDFNIGSISALGAVHIQAGDRLVLNTDLTVHGEVLADSLYSDGSVTAGTGIHAGIPGSVNPVAGISTLGGVSVGIPGPTVPGVVTATTMVTAPAVIGSTIVFGGILMDPEGGAPLMRAFYNSHFHIAPFGPTSPPVIPMP